MIGANTRVRRSVVVIINNYIPFEKVLKTNFLLQEENNYLMEELHEAYKSITLLKTEINQLRSRFKEHQTIVNEYKAANEMIKVTLVTITGIFYQYNKSQKDQKELYQENIKLAFELKDI